MKKKIIVTLLSVILAFSMSACSGKADSNETSDKSTSDSSSEIKEEDSAAPETELDFPEGDYSDTGEGVFSIQTSSGDSSDGSVPVLFVSADEILVQIGYLAENMDGSHLSFIYIDGMEAAKDRKSVV